MNADVLFGRELPAAALLAGDGPCPICSGMGELEATDIFCGAGGSSLGLESVRCPACLRPLIRVTQALNHWDLAVDAHNANFPDADHDVHDVEEIPASRFRRTPILWASPDCTHHAYCRGPKSDSPEAQRSRATFRDVVRFTEHHRYDAVLIENVIEARMWCDDPKHGDRCSCGSSFSAWYSAMLELGYQGQVVMFNSQFALPTPQSRDRMYVVFWRNGLPAPQLDFRPLAWCGSCEDVVRGVQWWKPTRKGTSRSQPGMFEVGRFGTSYVYRCPDCDDVVAPAVVGARQIIDWSLDMHRIGDKPKAPKTRERIKHGLMRLATLDPIAVQVGGNLYERRAGVRVWSMNDPFRTVVGTSQHALVVPAGGQVGQARTAGVTSENHRALVLRYGGQQPSPRAIAEPMQTITAHDREIGLVVPNREHAVGGSVDEPAGTVTTAPSQHMLVSFRNHADVTPIDEPAHAVTSGGNHHGLLMYNGVPGFVRQLDDAAGTITARDKQSLLVPYYSHGLAKPLGEPIDAVTAKDREALVVTEDDVDDCLFRMLQWHELLRAQAPHDHLDGRRYELTARRKGANGKMRDLSNENRVKMIGNMVSAPVATLLGWAVAESLA